MKDLQYLPLEFKRDDKTKAEGRYLIKHPLIDRYYFEVTVTTTESAEQVSIKLICLVSRTKGTFRNVTRYSTFEDCQMIKECFWNEDEEVIQYQKINEEEVAQGNYCSNLFKLLK